MSAAASARVLCVDDEPFVLDGLRRALHGHYDLAVTASPGEALAWVTSSPEQFDVVMSDLKMPGTDGITLLSQVRDLAPASVRVLLTGHGDLGSAMDAVNRGSIFRFLCKPAKRAELIDALDAAAEQHRLIVAERELLEQTLRGSVAALMETLSLANPTAFARTGRIRRIVAALAEESGAGGWELEVAAMLSQIGAVTVGADIIAKLEAGQGMTVEERRAVDAVPAVSERLLAAIPRLDEVRRIIRHQDCRYDGRTTSSRSGYRSSWDGPAGDDLPIGSRILKVALDLDSMETKGQPRYQALRLLREREGAYDPELLALLERTERPATEQREVVAAGLAAGMVLEADVRDVNDVLLVPRGREITEQLLAVLMGYVERGRVTGRFTVSVTDSGTLA